MAGKNGPGRTDSGTSVASLCRSIKDQLSASEELIAALKRQLAESRGRNHALVQERNDLARSLAQAETRPVELAAQARRRKQRQESMGVQEELRRENNALSQRCIELEEALAAKSRELVGAAEETACLEEQVAHLQSMVDLLMEYSGVDSAGLDQLLDAE